MIIFNDTQESYGTVGAGSSDLTAGGQGNSTKRLANSLSHQDDELIEELARTCFKSGGFYKPSAESSLPTAEEVEQEEIRRLGHLGYKPTSISEEKKDKESGYNTHVTPQVNNRKGNELIKIDESQFVTLS